MNLCHMFKGLSDPVRLRIAHLLVQRGELCVCHLTDVLQLPQSTVSRHLNILRNSGLVDSERRGKWVYYRFVNNETQVIALADMLRKGGASDSQLQRDLAGLKKPVC